MIELIKTEKADVFEATTFIDSSIELTINVIIAQLKPLLESIYGSVDIISINTCSKYIRFIAAGEVETYSYDIVIEEQPEKRTGFKLLGRALNYTNKPIIKLVSAENGFHDFDISGINGVIRATVSNDIKKGDIFNIYYAGGRKIGGVWKGTKGIHGYLIGDLEKAIIVSDNLVEKAAVPPNTVAS